MKNEKNGWRSLEVEEPFGKPSRLDGVMDSYALQEQFRTVA